VTVLSVNSCDWKCRHSFLPPPALVEPAREDEHVADRLLGDAGRVDTARVGDGDAVVGQRVHRHVVGAGEGTREQLEPIGALEEIFLDRDACHDPRLRNEFAFFRRRSRERNGVIGQPFTQRFGVRRHRQPFRPLGERRCLDPCSWRVPCWPTIVTRSLILLCTRRKH